LWGVLSEASPPSLLTSRGTTGMAGTSQGAPLPTVAIRSVHLTIFWHCGGPYFSFRTASDRAAGNQPSMVLAEDALPKGLAMLIRSQMYGVLGGAADAVCPQVIPAASLPTLLLGGLLLLIGP
jgi:hypothetical protein